MEFFKILNPVELFLTVIFKLAEKNGAQELTKIYLNIWLNA